MKKFLQLATRHQGKKQTPHQHHIRVGQQSNDMKQEAQDMKLNSVNLAARFYFHKSDWQ
jgi:hypothetical protein